MENKTIIQELNELLNSSEKYMLIDDKGKLFELDEAKEKGIKGTVERINPEAEIFKLLGLKPERITLNNIMEVDNIIQFLLDKTSYPVKRKYMDEKLTEYKKRDRELKEPKIKAEKKK